MNHLLGRQTIEHLLSLSNVIGIGYGLKEIAGELTDQNSIVVMVSKKVPEIRLTQDEIVPKFIEGIISDVIEVGHVSVRRCRPDHDQNLAPDILEFNNARKLRWRPAPGGVSIGHYKITAGTLGAVVYDRCRGRKFILSNNHVFANSTNGKDHRASKGDPILQPGPINGGTVKCDTIARLYRYVPLKDKGINIVDAAVARPLRPRLIDPYILGIGTVKGTSLPELGMIVKKSGRTTGVTYGRIRVINAIVSVHYHNGRILKFTDQILVNAFDQPGDSGSLVLDEYNRAIGLLFAGSDRYTFINPINPVLDLLGVEFKKSK